MQPEMQNQQPVFTGNTDVAVQQNKVLRSTYTLLAVSLIPTIVGAWIGTSVFNIAGLMRGVGPIIASIAVLAIFCVLISCGGRERSPPPGMALVPAGEFIMGSNKVDTEGLQQRYGLVKPLYLDEHPQQHVVLKSFYIDRYEVSNQFRELFVEKGLRLSGLSLCCS